MNVVICCIMLAVLLDGQAPSLPPPSLPPSIRAVQSTVPDSAAPAALPSKEMPKLPAAPVAEGLIPVSAQAEGPKPPPFRLIEPPPTGNAAPAPARPALSAEAVLADGAVTPCLLLARAVPPIARAGQPLCYEIVVRNAGSFPVAHAQLEELLPQGTKFVSAQPMPLARGERLVWTLENIGPGAELRFKVEVEPNHKGDWKATATLTVSISSATLIDVGGGLEPNPSVPQPEIPMTQAALTITGPSSIPVGHAVVLFMRVTNSTAAVLSDAAVRVQLSPGLQHLQGNAIEGSLGDLAPGQSKDLTLEAYALQTGKLSADAALLSSKKSIASAQTTVEATAQPTLALHQTGPLTLLVGSEHEFKVAVTNRSSAELRDVRVSDVLPEGLLFTGGDSGAAFDAATKKINWNLGMIQPGQTRYVLFRARVGVAGPVVNRLSARAAGVPEAQLNTILQTQQQINNR